MSTRCTHTLRTGLRCKLKAKDDQNRCKRHTQHQCPVCLELIGEGDKKTLICKHTFHMNCILSWFVEGDTCPVCRVSQRRDELIVFREEIQESMRRKYMDAIGSLESDIRQMRAPRTLPHRRRDGFRFGEIARRALDGDE